MGDTIEEVNHNSKVDSALYQVDMILTKYVASWTDLDDLQFLQDFLISFSESRYRSLPKIFYGMGAVAINDKHFVTVDILEHYGQTIRCTIRLAQTQKKIESCSCKVMDAGHMWEESRCTGYVTRERMRIGEN
ncbi:hypothetical protein KIN20_007240 [Parelaphostrongylus tenuis]|uniref:Uncharacterized protein n=1 Tax=Parelaphostrongylus tenuis TaxID=148309 RepID=A0AAD5ML85_PARTN|nr:hypothetical protein KIN20_007240 [Parelaphostrongylus tenuis]